MTKTSARFLRTAPPYLRLAMLLAINTGQRQGDLLRLPWSAYDGTNIKLRQGKTGAYVPPSRSPTRSKSGSTRHHGEARSC